MALVKGPFTLKWGSNTLTNVKEISTNYDVESSDFKTLDGRTFKIEGAHSASVEVTLLESDVAAIRTILPQYYVAKNAKLSTGETVNNDAGAIDIVAAKCDTTTTSYDLDIVSCNGQVTRLVNARSALSSTEFEDNVVRTVTITFTAEPKAGQAALQFFGDGHLTPA
jgi:hypothetical protein|nr:MAG TPA: hypothetical protein [Caudoviricetes sp.]DAX51355.1 MAG TPA: hypothetical protein [Caudoviricetes sp.]